MSTLEPTLDEQYLKAVEEQKNYLEQLQNAFNLHCDEITAETQKKLEGIPETDTELREKIIDEQKVELKTALSQLRAEIEKSSTASRAKLEDINRQREEIKLKEIENLMIKTL
jgi:hypothetical protein